MSVPSFGGPWTQEKLEILRQYLDRYTTVLKKRSFRLTYVDAFAGAGTYADLSDEYEEFYELHQGSAQIALEIDDRPFDRFVFIENNMKRVESLNGLASQYQNRNIRVVPGDANAEIPEFCSSMGTYDRAVVFLDPYATQVSWTTVEAIAGSGKIDCWILFPLMAVTRMMPTDREPDDATSRQLDRIFGERDHWQKSYYDSPQLSLFAEEPRRERLPGSELIADRYRQRLLTVFSSVASAGRTLKNSKNAALFELFFAASNARGLPIANHLLKHW